MNAVEIEEAVSALAEQPFDGAEFPFAFLQAFGNKATTIKRLRSGELNNSDLGGVLQRGNIHIKVYSEGEAVATLAALKASPATARARAKFVLATDGIEFHAEDLSSGDVVVCDYPDFPEHFGFFLPLAGITTVRQIRESAFDIKATGRLNRLYVELLKENPDWGAADRRHEMNHFMARLIFCFFAEDTDIFASEELFTGMIERMSARDSSNTHEVIGEIFRATAASIHPLIRNGRAFGGIRPATRTEKPMTRLTMPLPPPPPPISGGAATKRLGILAAALVLAALGTGTVSAQTDDVCGIDNVCEIGVRPHSSGELTEGGAPLFVVFCRISPT